MALIVQKYGGTSVGSVERIKNVAARVKRHRDAGDDVVTYRMVDGTTWTNDARSPEAVPC